MVVPTLLLVEDECIIALDLARRLTKLGYTVLAVARSGREAVQQAGQLHPDLVLMDVGLPGGMDGIEAAAHIRAQAEIPIIYLTGSHEGMIPAGFTIQKPVTDQTLHQTIQGALATVDPPASAPSRPRSEAVGTPPCTRDRRSRPSGDGPPASGPHLILSGVVRRLSE